MGPGEDLRGPEEPGVKGSPSAPRAEWEVAGGGGVHLCLEAFLLGV